MLAAHLLSIVKIIAPIVPHLAEDAWQNLPFQVATEDGCIAKFVFESRWPALNERWLAFPDDEVHFWAKILELRTEVNKVLELARSEKLIGSSLEAKVYIHSSDANFATRLLQMCEADNDVNSLHRIFITSQAEIIPSLEDIPSEKVPYTGDYVIEGDNKVWVGVSRPDGSKCERCWNYSTKVGSFPEHPTLCARCYGAVNIQPIPALAAVS